MICNTAICIYLYFKSCIGVPDYGSKWPKRVAYLLMILLKSLLFLTIIYVCEYSCITAQRDGFHSKIVSASYDTWNVIHRTLHVYIGMYVCVYIYT